MRLLVIKKHNPDQWRRVMQLDGTCENKEVLEDAKKVHRLTQILKIKITSLLKLVEIGSVISLPVWKR